MVFRAFKFNFMRCLHKSVLLIICAINFNAGGSQNAFRRLYKITHARDALYARNTIMKDTYVVFCHRYHKETRTRRDTINATYTVYALESRK